MATLSHNQVPTLLDAANNIDPDGKEARIVELLSEENEILMDMPFIEGNLPTGHQYTVRTGLPTPVHRRLNAGVAVSDSEEAQVTTGAAMLESYSSVDKDVAELNGNTAAFRLNRNRAHMMAMSQTMAETLFYGSSANPEEIVGFAEQYSDLSAENGQNIIDAGGVSTDNTSIWLIGWSPLTVTGYYPKGSRAGLVHEDLGLETVQVDASGAGNGITSGLMRAYRDHYQWKYGLAVQDWRYAVRIANIDVSSIVADPTGSGVALLEKMLSAIHTIQSLTGVKPVFYCNRTIHQMIDIQAMNKANLHLKAGEEEGRLKITLRGVPIRRVDALIENEARVT